MTSRAWCWSRPLLVEGRRKPPRTPSSTQGQSEGRQDSGQRWVCGGHTPCSVRAPSRTLQPQPPTWPRLPYLLKRPTPSTTSRIRLLSWAPAIRYRAPSSRGAPRAAADSTFLHSGWGLRGLQGDGCGPVTRVALPPRTTASLGPRQAAPTSGPGHPTEPHRRLDPTWAPSCPLPTRVLTLPPAPSLPPGLQQARPPPSAHSPRQVPDQGPGGGGPAQPVVGRRAERV